MKEKERREESCFSSAMFYTHQTHWFRYPAVAAADTHLGLLDSDEGAFFNVFVSFQFSPDEDQPPE